MKARVPRATIDFETRSAANLKATGSWVYSLHPTTEALCMAYRLPHWAPGVTKLWHMAHPQHWIAEADPPEDLFEWIANGGMVEAHNAFFEKAIWFNVMMKRRGWPDIPRNQWMCSAAKACAHAIPRNLEMAVKAMGLPIEKDMDGRRIMLKLSKPRKLRKAERLAYEKQGIDPDTVIVWNEDEADILKNWAYCRNDVLSEEGLSESLEDLSPIEREAWLMDQEMNEKGVRVDRELVEAALDVAEQWVERLNAELKELTGIEKGSQRDQVREWLYQNETVLNRFTKKEERLAIADTTGAVVDGWLEDPGISPRARRVLTILRQVNRTSTKKYSSMLDSMSPEDDRIRDTVMYHGASTGRWTGKGVQPHNFPRGTFNTQQKIENAVAAIKTRDVEWVASLYGDPMEVLSFALRGAFIASPGRTLNTADFSAIEARVVLWLAGAVAALEVFRRGEDIYLDLAMAIYERHLTKKDKDERQLGKQGILGLGFGMGAPKFIDTCAKYGIVVSMELAQKVVDLYRKDKYPEIPRFWTEQEKAAIRAVQNPGQVIVAGRIAWRCGRKFLQCRLPSGRKLSYCDPRIQMRRTPWGEDRPALTYMGVDPKTKQWVRQSTYGGMITENIVQATARDFLRDAMLRVRASGVYENILSVHDENVAESDEGVGSLHEFEDLMKEVEKWGEGCPIDVEGWREPRYRK